ncbi:1477_t:CDS:1, partial [Gigaspora rosea]
FMKEFEERYLGGNSKLKLGIMVEDLILFKRETRNNIELHHRILKRLYEEIWLLSRQAKPLEARCQICLTSEEASITSKSINEKFYYRN